MLSSNIPNPLPPFGSQSVTLTCAVELSPAVNVPVTVNTVLTAPEGLMITSTAQPVMGNSTNHAATFRISPFRNSNSGVYTCSTTVSATSNAYISDSSTVIHSFRVTTGEMFAVLSFCAVFIITACLNSSGVYFFNFIRWCIY